MAYQDFTTYTEVDPTSKITVTSPKINVSAIPEEDSARVYKDFGSAYFNGNFEHLVTVYVNSSTTTGIASINWALANITTLDIKNNGTTVQEHVRTYEETSTKSSVFLKEGDGTNSYQDSWTLGSLDTPYYLKIKRDEAVGTYGTLYCYIYSDSGRTTLVDTLTLTLHVAKYDFQYLYGFANWGGTEGSYTWTGYTENLDIQEATTTSIKTFDGLAYASTKTVNGLAITSVKTWAGLA